MGGGGPAMAEVGQRIVRKLELYTYRLAVRDQAGAAELRRELHDDLDAYLDRVSAAVAEQLRASPR